MRRLVLLVLPKGRAHPFWDRKIWSQWGKSLWPVQLKVSLVTCYPWHTLWKSPVARQIAMCEILFPPHCNFKKVSRRPLEKPADHTESFCPPIIWNGSPRGYFPQVGGPHSYFPYPSRRLEPIVRIASCYTLSPREGDNHTRVFTVEFNVGALFL